MAPSSRFRAVSEGMSSIRDLLSVGDKERVPPDLKHALNLLELPDMKALEERFLSLDAFLKPWSTFRDSILYLHPDALSRSTMVAASATDEGITRGAILSFYTRYDEGTLRHDPRESNSSAGAATDHWDIDKSTWRADEYEKHLYVWLLQTFKVGKKHNPWRFTYFELKSTCSAWVDVFIPIVNAVRASYDVRGRRYYGRLALYIEKNCPSGLAFPAQNVAMAEATARLSFTEPHVVEPNTLTHHSAPNMYPQYRSQIGLTKKFYDDTEKELRDVYPQYGGLVERPKFKQRLDDWLVLQRERAAEKRNKKRLDMSLRQEESRFEDGEVLTESWGGYLSPDKNDSSHNWYGNVVERSTSTIKRYSSNIRRSLSLNSPHRNANTNTKLECDIQGVSQESRTSNHPVVSAGVTQHWTSKLPTTRPEVRNSLLEKTLYRHSRRPSSFINDLTKRLQQQKLAPTEDIDPYRFDLAEVISEYREQPPFHQVSALHEQQLHWGVRSSSYEDIDEQNEMSLNDLDMDRKKAAQSPAPPVPSRSLARLSGNSSQGTTSGYQRNAFGGAYHGLSHMTSARPSPPSVVPEFLRQDAPMSDYTGTGFSHETRSTTSRWGGSSPPKAIPWPGFESDEDLPKTDETMHKASPTCKANETAPTEPPKLSGRRKPPIEYILERNRRLAQEGTLGVHRIVSKENIRSALGASPRESLTEDVPPHKPTAMPSRPAGPPGSWQTYNKHMFPRKEAQEDHKEQK